MSIVRKYIEWRFGDYDRVVEKVKLYALATVMTSCCSVLSFFMSSLTLKVLVANGIDPIYALLTSAAVWVVALFALCITLAFSWDNIKDKIKTLTSKPKVAPEATEATE